MINIISVISRRLSWDTKLAMGHGKFRLNGTYNTFAGGRAVRRKKAREAAKAAKRGDA